MAHVDIDRVLELLTAADGIDLPLWLSGGWALDARLGRITRPHADIDVAFPQERRRAFLDLLASFGPATVETVDYGLLVTVDGVLIDAEPCARVGDRYEIAGPPPGTCPWQRQGILAGRPVRCVSWEALLWDWFHYLEEAPPSAWRSQDRIGYELTREAYGAERTDRLREAFGRREGA